MSVDLQKIAADAPLAERSFWSIVLTLFFGSFVGMYHTVSLNMSLPGFIHLFNTQLGTVQWIVTGFTLAAGVIAPVTGYAIDRFGGKRLFLFALAGVNLCAVLCALSWNIYALIVFRVLQGIFCGLLQPLSLAMIYQLLPEQRRPFAVSVWSFSTVLGTALAPSMSGWLQEYDWHWIFLVTLPIGVVVCLLGARLLPADRCQKRIKLDGAGLTLAAVASLALLLVFGNLQAWGWGSAKAWICLTVGLGCGIGFIVHELRTDAPLLQLRLFRSIPFTVSLIISLILQTSLYAGITFIPLYLADMQGLSALQIALLFLPAAFCLTCATLISGHFYTKFGAGWLILCGGLILVGTTYHFSSLQPDTSLLSIMLWLSLRNTGTGLAMTPATNVGMSAIPEALSGHASALINWLRTIFSAMTISLLTSVFTVRLDGNRQQLLALGHDQSDAAFQTVLYTMSFHDIFIIASVITAVALPLSFLVMHRGDPKRGN
ncbi:DHA2 family efflux MFS transporter permease subunit [Brevibacillus fluminis]|nr:DHA2 family efflux MFS transporter permease subunit [Brevibacillus fluminis]